MVFEKFQSILEANIWTEQRMLLELFITGIQPKDK